MLDVRLQRKTALMWIYQDTMDAPTESDVTRDDCIFCGSKMIYMPGTTGEILTSEARLCLYCGWWSRNERFRKLDYEEFKDSGCRLHYYSMDGACGQLKALDLKDIETPLEEVNRYLVAKYQDRFEVNPRKYEEVVGSVFRSLGYQSEVTAYQKDGGIDVILRDAGSTIGVQVKRYKQKIEAEQIRSLAGALILNDHTSGIFVTTSSFRAGAVKAGKDFVSRGIPIELFDANRFYDALKIAETMEITEDNAEDIYYDVIGAGHSQVIYENEGPF